jgi:starch phosphorylase
MSQLTPRFSANRTVREYTEKYYVPLAETYQFRADEKGKKGKQMLEWLNELQHKWSALQFGEVKVETDGDKHIFEVEVFLNSVEPDEILVELYANGTAGSNPVRLELKLFQQVPQSGKAYLYKATVSATRPATDYTPRVIPKFPGVSIPLETNLILWQH